MTTTITRSGNAERPRLQSTSEAKTTDINEKECINPMITSSGDTYRVSSALTALACLLEAEQTMEPDDDQGLGLSIILQTCSAALRHMQREKA